MWPEVKPNEHNLVEILINENETATFNLTFHENQHTQQNSNQHF